MPDRTRRPRNAHPARWIVPVAFAAIVVVCGAVVAARVVPPAAQRDLRSDIVWSRVDGPPAKRTVAYRWYPLTYPILERWSFGDDPDRSQYAFETILHFGGLLSRHWLDAAIDRNPTGYGNGPPYSGDPHYALYRHEMGLDNAWGRRRAAERAVHHLAPYDDEGDSFDQRLLASLGADALPALDAWSKHAAPHDLSALFGALPEYGTTLSAADAATVARLRGLADREFKRGDTASADATPPANPRDVAVYDAVVALDGGDTRGLPLLRTIVDGDLRRFDVDLPSPNLVAVAQAFPNSRFTRACLAYDALRGGTYFGRDDDTDERAPTASAAAWRSWLAQYPDHPGADDATYWLGRTLQRNGRRFDALVAYAEGLRPGVGDGDMDTALWSRFQYLLDVGTTEADLAAFEAMRPRSPLAPFARYARAVRRARANDFPAALGLVRTLDLLPAIRALPPESAYFQTTAPALVKAIAAQTARWRRLAIVVPDIRTASLETRERLASAWNEDDGYEIGYLELFTGFREGGSTYYFSDVWPPLASTAQAANQNAQTIAFATPLASSSASVEVRRRNERRIVVALYRQQAEFPDLETDAMGELPSFSPPGGADARFEPESPLHFEAGYRGAEAAAAVETAWARQSAIEAERYVREYPNDDFDSTALLAAFEVTDRTTYLRELIARYPADSRAEEARALLWRATTPR